jgi:hypothetical protein
VSAFPKEPFSSEVVQQKIKIISFCSFTFCIPTIPPNCSCSSTLRAESQEQGVQSAKVVVFKKQNWQAVLSSQGKNRYHFDFTIRKAKIESIFFTFFKNSCHFCFSKQHILYVPFAILIWSDLSDLYKGRDFPPFGLLRKMSSSILKRFFISIKFNSIER